MVQLRIKPLTHNKTWCTTLKNSSQLLKKLMYPGIVEYKKLRVLKQFSASYRLFAIQESTVLYELQGLEPWAQEELSWEESLSKGAAVWNSSEYPSLVVLLSSLHGIHFSNLVMAQCETGQEVKDGASSVQWDCQPCTKSIQIISLANNPTSKDPFRCPWKDNSC